MIERLLENWLDSANERSWQQAFCQMLMNQGYTVLHSTRHTPIEFGKDVIAVAPDGTPCAFQLKGLYGKKLNLTGFREIESQLTHLIEYPVVHPALQTQAPHHAYLVISGEFEDEVIHAIDLKNRGYQQSGNPQKQLRTIVKGQLLEWANALHSNLWPSDITPLRPLLELYLMDGREPLPKPIYAELCDALFSLLNHEMPKPLEAERRIAVSVLMCSLALSNISKERNHSAEVEGWTIAASYLIAYADKFGLDEKLFRPTFNMIMEHVHGTLALLREELIPRTHYVEGDALTDPPVYGSRMTTLVGLMSILWLWDRTEGKECQCPETDDFLRRFVREHINSMQLWGEAAIPHFLSAYFCLRECDASPRGDFFLYDILRTLLASCQGGARKAGAIWDGFPNPYYSFQEIMELQWGMKGVPHEDRFAGYSYCAEALLHLYARTLWKLHLRLLWPEYTRIVSVEFNWSQPWEMCRWINRESGKNQGKVHPPTMTWNDLKKEAWESEGAGIPALLKAYPVFMLLFMTVYPHRLTSSCVRWLDSEMRRLFP